MVLPLVVAAGLATVFAGAGLFMLTRHSDDISIERQRREAALAVDDQIGELARLQEVVAVWDDAVLELRNPNPDWRWIDDNFGTWLSELYGYETYILDAADMPIYASIGGEQANPLVYEEVAPALRPFIDAVRGRTTERNNIHERLPGQPLNPAATVQTSPAAVHATDLTWIGGQPAAVSAMLMTPHTENVAQAAGTEPVLVSVRYLASLLDEIAVRNLIASPRFSETRDLRRGESALALASDRGAFGFFIWRPELPGSVLRRWLIWVGIALVGVLSVIMTVLARSLYAALRDQHMARMGLENAMLEVQASEAQAQHLAFHDVLTGMANRALFNDRIEHALGAARSDSPLALLMLDLDRFKYVNDTFGHAAGDMLIREVAGRLTALTPESATAARLGGDEFVLFAPDIRSEAQAKQLCNRIIEAVNEPFEILGNQVYVGVSIGMAFAPKDGAERSELMRKADIALYRAKSEGRDQYRVFEIEMDESVRFRRMIEEDLRRALRAGDQLCVYYQPQVAAADGPIIGLEALVRWRHPARGLISPENFVPIAEDTGLIDELGEWVLEQACATARRWPDLFVAVNLSPAQFKAPDFAERAEQIVRGCGVEPRQIEFEVTETVLQQDDDLATRALAALRNAGFRIALDDFGTGYSSLSHLRRFEVDKIKIDRSFVQNLGKPESSAIVTAVVSLGHAMGLQVTAEGVETADQSRFLSAAGCNVMQGYLFSKALPESEVAELLGGQEMATPELEERESRVA